MISIGTGREPREVDCPECLRLVAEAEAGNTAAVSLEQGFGVWWFEVSNDRYWVAAETQHAAYRYLRSQPCGSRTPMLGAQVTDLDENNMPYGDTHEGEEQQVCSLRDLLRWKLRDGYTPPVIIAGDDR